MISSIHIQYDLFCFSNDKIHHIKGKIENYKSKGVLSLSKEQKIFLGQTIHALICLGYEESSVKNFLIEIIRSMESVSEKDALIIAEKFNRYIEPAR